MCLVKITCQGKEKRQKLNIFSSGFAKNTMMQGGLHCAEKSSRKKDRLVKRVFALCLALAVICTCLVPVFATEGLSDLQVEKELPGTSEEEAAGFGDDFPAVDDGEPREVYDDSEAAGFGEEEASRPVDDEGGEDNLDGGPNVKETEWGTVIDYGTSTSTSTDPSSSTETQWSGEDDVVEKPDDKVVVSGDEIKKLQDMVVYRFWLKELNANDLQDITAQAQINNMTESEYLARNGEVLWNLYFIQAVPRVETIADYSSYIENPSSNRDPKGELRLFDYWYTLDEFGNRVRLNLTDPTSNILDDKTTTVNVYAAWKDGTVGSDEEEDVDHEDLVDKNPVPVDLTAKASASYEDEDGNTKSVNLPVEVKNLPSAADHLSVIHMGDDDMESFYKSHSSDFEGMEPLLGLKISPKNAKGEKVQPAKGEKATVTVSGLDALPYMVKATAGELKVLHQTADGSVETLDVLSYQNGTLTFETSSFSPFVIASVNGYAADTMDTSYTFDLGETTTLEGKNGSNHTWSATPSDAVRITPGRSNSRYAKVKTLRKVSQVTIVHEYDDYYGGKRKSETFTIEITDSRNSGDAPLYLYALLPNVTWDGTQTESNNFWFGLGIASINPEKYVETRDTETINSLIGNGNGITLTPYTGSYTFVSALDDDTDTHTLNTYSSSLKLFPTIKINQKGKIEYPKDDEDGYVYWNGKEEDKPVDKPYYTIEWINLGHPYGAPESGYNSPEEVKGHNNECEYLAYHLDARVNFSDKCNVDFKVKYPGQTRFTMLDQETYSETVDIGYLENKIKQPQNRAGNTKFNVDQYKDAGYRFDGWYEDEECTQKAEFNGTIKEDKVYYGRFIKESSNLKISKTVTGLLGDTKKAFTFTIMPTDGTKTFTITESDIVEKSDEGVTYDLSKKTFTLTHGAYITLSLPVGSYVVEETAVDNYTAKYKIGSADEVPGNSAEVTLGDTNQTLAFINHCGLKPDTGVLLDTLPYIVILAVVAGGVALLMLRKHRKEDD